MKPTVLIPVFLLSMAVRACSDTATDITSGTLQVLYPPGEFGSVQFALSGPGLLFSGNGETLGGPCASFGGIVCKAGSTEDSHLVGRPSDC
jgi:hypothetical protein